MTKYFYLFLFLIGMASCKKETKPSQDLKCFACTVYPVMGGASFKQDTCINKWEDHPVLRDNQGNVENSLCVQK